MNLFPAVGAGLPAKERIQSRASPLLRQPLAQRENQP